MKHEVFFRTTWSASPRPPCVKVSCSRWAISRSWINYSMHGFIQEVSNSSAYLNFHFFHSPTSCLILPFSTVAPFKYTTTTCERLLCFNPSCQSYNYRDPIVFDWMASPWRVQSFLVTLLQHTSVLTQHTLLHTPLPRPIATASIPAMAISESFTPSSQAVFFLAATCLTVLSRG